MKRKLKLFLLASACFCGLCGWTQNAGSDFLKVTKTYAGLSQCSTRVRTYLYGGPEDNRPKLTLSSEVRYNPTGQWVRNQHLEMLYNDRCVLLIDHLKKQVQYSKPVRLDKIRKQASGALPDTAMLKAYRISLLKKENGEVVYHLQARNAKSEFIGMDYVIDLGTYRFREIVYYCRPQKQYQKIRVVYEYFDARPDFGKEQFSETAIISGKGETAELTKAYAAYELLNGYNRNLKKILNDE